MKKIVLFLTVSVFIFACAGKDIRDTSLEPAAAFQKAEDLISQGNYEEARKVLGEIRGGDEAQQYSALARLRIADTYFEEESFEEAVAEYESHLETYPAGKYASYAQYKLAMSFFRQIKTADISYSVAQRSLREFEKLRKNYPRNPHMEVTEERIKACQRVLAEFEFYVGSFYFKKGSYEAAARRFDGLLKDYPDSVQEAGTLYYLGLSYKNLGRKEQAIDTLSILIGKFPTIKYSIDAKEVIASLKQ
ncbi:MAG: tetratricopeptide repeat protein [Nitrospirae bacterium]|nr:tetratricopeptide repeat protein [Nitrospirota bacterium]